MPVTDFAWTYPDNTNTIPEPYTSARRVFWVVDNGPSHRGRPSIERLEGAYRNLRLIHLPIHASWLNQVEIYFGILERKVLTPPAAVSLDELAARILAFGASYESSLGRSNGGSPAPISIDSPSGSPSRLTPLFPWPREYITEYPWWST